MKVRKSFTPGVFAVAFDPLNGSPPMLFMIGQSWSSAYSRVVLSMPNVMTFGSLAWMVFAAASSWVQVDGGVGLSPAFCMTFLLYQRAYGPTVHGIATCCPLIVPRFSSRGMICP